MAASHPSSPVASTVVIVCGLPCAGKSTAARQLRDSLGWPLLAKDPIKESLFESLGWSDRAWSKRVSGASYALMFDIARELLTARQSCILEGNFRWEENEAHFRSLMAARPTTLVQVFCTASPDVLIDRWRARSAGNERHPGHVDRDSTPEIEAELRHGAAQPLRLGEPALIFDSSAPLPRELDELVAEVRRRSAAGRSPG